MQRAYSLERGARGSELERCPLLLPLGAQRVRKAHAGECHLVRGADIAPLLCGGLEGHARACVVALCQPYPSLSERGTRPKAFALERRGHAAELLGRRPGPAEITCRNLDLHLRL